VRRSFAPWFSVRYDMKTLSAKIIITSLPFVLLLGCKHSTEPDTSQANYSPLNTGDQLQLVNLADSSTQFFTVLGNQLRQDGLVIFAVQEKIGTFAADTVFRFIRDGYLIATQIDSVTPFSLPGNPYAESRIAKLNPTDGDSWIEELSSSDTVTVTVSSVPTLTTICSTFQNVFALTSTQHTNGQTFVTGPEYYANLIGLVGYDAQYLGRHFQWRAVYIKSGNTEMGSPWPAKQFLPL